MESLEEGGITLSVDDGRYSLVDRSGKLGWRDMGFCVLTNEGQETLVAEEVAREGSVLRLTGHYAVSGLCETVEMDLQANGALVVSRTFSNPGEQSVTVCDARAGRVDGRGGPVFAKTRIWTLRMAHMDNLRIERFPWCRPEAPYVTTVPTAPRWFGNQENQALPVIMLTNTAGSEVLLEGQLAQEKARARWQVGGAPNGPLLGTWLLSWELVGGGVLLQAGASMALEPVYYEIRTDTHVQDAWSGYFDAAVARNAFRSGADNVLTRKAFYCSWNYGIMQNFTDESLLKTARHIGENLPEVEFFLIDGGWQGREAVGCPDCANFYLPEDHWIDREKLPGGMEALVAGIRAAGLRPAIWWTPSVSLSSTLAREHPEWLAKDTSGAPHRIGKSGYLDVSLLPVQEYLRTVWDILFNRWGFEAMKMDFWCQAFESDHITYAAGTNMENRDWLLETLRSFIPQDGFLMTCVATAQGNVFLGKHAESYRCCIDIGNCAWPEHPIACCWIQPLLTIPGRETTLLNADGFGVNAALSDGENLHRLTYGFITMGSLEVDGRIEELAPQHLDWLRRLTSHVDRGYPVRCPDNEAFVGQPFPKVLYVDYPAGSPTRARGVVKHVALFNWTDEDQYVGATAVQLGLDGAVTARDFWTDAAVAIPAEGWCERLPRRSARLVEITAQA